MIRSLLNKLYSHININRVLISDTKQRLITKPGEVLNSTKDFYLNQFKDNRVYPKAIDGKWSKIYLEYNMRHKIYYSELGSKITNLEWSNMLAKLKTNTALENQAMAFINQTRATHNLALATNKNIDQILKLKNYEQLSRIKKVEGSKSLAKNGLKAKRIINQYNATVSKIEPTAKCLYKKAKKGNRSNQNITKSTCYSDICDVEWFHKNNLKEKM
ncbi:21924_t:CDS:2 [Gigaspora margarita]|uniref:21924_t:CDS:1 n=1 Tax=Gigaspora margarita TaxID=4874 RepID=A0ABM8W3I3_GIGMA|nr:21924_t:CDS:2 [Gigaspora margarita]